MESVKMQTQIPPLKYKNCNTNKDHFYHILVMAKSYIDFSILLPKYGKQNYLHIKSGENYCKDLYFCNLSFYQQNNRYEKKDNRRKLIHKIKNMYAINIPTKACGAFSSDQNDSYRIHYKISTFSDPINSHLIHT